MFYEEMRTKQVLSYISVCALCILYNSKFVLLAMSLGTNAVVVFVFIEVLRHSQLSGVMSIAVS